MDDEKNWPSHSQGYQIVTTIGVGAFGTVYAAIVQEGRYTRQRVAVKILDLEKFPDSNLEEIHKEISIMRFCQHPNVLNYYRTFLESRYLWMVMPLLEGGSVGNILRSNFPDGIRDENLLATILKETLQGLIYFHATGQIHRDIKAGNILLSSNGDVLLGDFGVAAKLKEGSAARTLVGSPCWIAPEVIDNDNRGGYNFKVDIWSFGITAIELARGRPPLHEFPPMKVMLKVLESDPPQLGPRDPFSKEFKEMVNSCLQKNPDRRPTAEELIRKKFFRAARDNSYVHNALLVRLPPIEQRRIVQDQLQAPERQEQRPQDSGGWDFSLSGDHSDVAGGKARDPLEGLGDDEDDALDDIGDEDDQGTNYSIFQNLFMYQSVASVSYSNCELVLAFLQIRQLVYQADSAIPKFSFRALRFPRPLVIERDFKR